MAIPVVKVNGAITATRLVGAPRGLVCPVALKLPTIVFIAFVGADYEGPNEPTVVPSRVTGVALKECGECAIFSTAQRER